MSAKHSRYHATDCIFVARSKAFLCGRLIITEDFIMLASVRICLVLLFLPATLSQLGCALKCGLVRTPCVRQSCCGTSTCGVQPGGGVCDEVAPGQCPEGCDDGAGYDQGSHYNDEQAAPQEPEDAAIDVPEPPVGHGASWPIVVPANEALVQPVNMISPVSMESRFSHLFE